MTDSTGGDTAVEKGSRGSLLVPALLSLLPPLVAVVVESIFLPVIQPSIWVLFYPAVFLSAWIAGMRGAIVATAVSLAAVLWLFFPPTQSFVPPTQSFAKPPWPYAPALVFVTTGVLFGVLHGRLQRALAASKAAIARLKQAVDERRVFEAFVENSTDFIGIADPSGRPVYVNPAGRRMVGMAPDHPVEATRIPEYYPADVRAFASDVILKSMTEKGLWQGETFFHNWSTGESIPVSDTHFMIRDPATRSVLGMGTITRDITELRRAAREQEFLVEIATVLASTLDYDETEANIAALIVRELADVCIVETMNDDADDSVRRKIAFNAQHVSAGEALRRTLLDRRRPDLGSSVYATRQPLLIGEITEEYLDSIAQGPEHRDALRGIGLRSLLTLPLLAHGRLVGALVLLRSAATPPFSRADLPLAEEVARRAAMAVENAGLYHASQRARQARDEMLAVVAHDLRNPLGLILTLTARLRRRGSEPDRRSQTPADSIERAVTRMNRLIQDLLDVTRIEAGHLAIAQARVSAGRVVADSLEAEGALVAAASLELETDAAVDSVEVWADRDRLLQVFENLIGNGIKFTPAGGRIRVGAAAREREVLFWVSDTGAGISADEIPHVFDRFWQARKAGRQGAGLGLPIVKGIVEAHGGRIWVDSAPGRGSTFFFTIPTAPGATAAIGA